MTLLSDPTTLADDALLLATQHLVDSARWLDADLVLHLAEVDARRLYLRIPLPSLFAYCRSLGLSEDAAYNRIEVARLARRHPAAIEALRSGRVHLTGLRLLAPHLTTGNLTTVLADAEGKSKREIEELVAKLAPKPPVPDSIRKLPATAGALLSAPPTELASQPPSHETPPGTVALPAPGPGDLACTSARPSAEPSASTPVPPVAASAPARTLARRDAMSALDEATYKIQFTASRVLRDKLMRALDLLARTDDSDLAGVVERGLDMLLLKLERRRFGSTAQPRRQPAPQPACDDQGPAPRTSSTACSQGLRSAAPPSGHKSAEVPARGVAPAGSMTGPDLPGSKPPPEIAAPVTRHIPNAIKRKVYERDLGQCAFVDPDSGRRCPERRGLEFDHIAGFARTRTHSVEGIRLLCHNHNQYAAEQLYGRKRMDEARRRTREVPASDLTPPGRGRPGTTPPVSADRMRERTEHALQDSLL